MQTIVRLYDLKPGDRVTVPKSGLNVVHHDGLYLGYDEFGRHWMVENLIGRGVTLVDAGAFFIANPVVNNVARFEGDNQGRRAAVEKALASVGRPYNLVNYNCQHFATEIQTGRPRSRQVDRTFAVG